MRNFKIHAQNDREDELEEYEESQQARNNPKIIRPHKIRKIRRPPIRSHPKDNKFSFFGGRPGRVFPTNYAELLYRQRNGKYKFEQAVRKKRILNIIVGVSVAIALAFLLILVLSVVAFIIIKFSKGDTKVVATVTGNYSKIYVSTDSNQISNIFFQIVQRSVASNSSLYLSFVDYNMAKSTVKKRYIENKKKKRNIFSIATEDYLFISSFENMVNNLNWTNKGFYLDGEYVSILSYLNNVAVISTSFDDLQFMMVDLYNKSSNSNLIIDLNNTKW